jgi:DNA-binding transcriptional regulator YiaG
MDAAWEFRKAHLKATCEVCGIDDGLVLHHKDRNRSNNKRSNLQTLCRSCHSREHWREKLKNEKRLLKTAAASAASAVSPKTIRRVRDALNETQEQFAQRIGIKQSTLSKWESGGAPIRYNQALLLQRILAEITAVHPDVK